MLLNKIKNNLTEEEQKTINELTNKYINFEFENEDKINPIVTEEQNEDKINHIVTEEQNEINNLTEEFLKCSTEMSDYSDDYNNFSNNDNNKNNESNSYNSRIEYFKKILSNYYSNKKFLEFLYDITIDNDFPVKNYVGFNEIHLKSKTNQIILGPIDRDFFNGYEDDFIINFDEMTIPMCHFHLNENLNFPKTDFFYAISGNETAPLKQFFNRIKLLDNYLEDLIQKYIERIDEQSPLYELLKKYNVSAKKNWNYINIINNKNGKEYLNINYKKNTSNKDFKIKTMIYHGEELIDDLMNKLANDNLNTFVTGDIYPIIEVSSLTVYVKKTENGPVVTFKPKVYFADIMIKKDTLRYGVNYSSPIEYCKELLNDYCSFTDFSHFCNDIHIKSVSTNKNLNNFYTMSLRNENNSPIYIGPINKELNIEEKNVSNMFIDLNKMTLPMRHYHLNENFNYVNSNFYYNIDGNEKGPLKLFLEKVKQMDTHLKYLIQEYIRNIDEKSPIYSLLKKNNVTPNNCWVYNGIISKSKNKEFLTIDYSKKSFTKSDQIGTKIYDDNKLLLDLMNQLSDDSKNTYVYGDIYPIFKIESILVYEKKINEKNVVYFKAKAFFPTIIAKKDTLKYGILKSQLQKKAKFKYGTLKSQFQKKIL